MRQPPRPIVGTAIDPRTALDRAEDELTESLRQHGDAATVAVVIRFVDQMRDITDRVLFRDYEFGNGEQFYSRAGTSIALPQRPADRPNRDFPEWHLGEVFN